MFRDYTTSYTENNLLLDIYLGPIIYVVPIFTAKILNSNDKVVHRSAYQDLMPDDIQSKYHKSMCDVFDESIYDKLGSFASPDYFDILVNKETTTFHFYDDYTNNDWTTETPYEKEGVTS